MLSALAEGENPYEEVVQVDEIDKKVEKVFNDAIGDDGEFSPVILREPDQINPADIAELKRHTNIKDLGHIELKNDPVDKVVVNDVKKDEPFKRVSQTNLEVINMSDVKRTLDIGIIGVGGAGNKIADAFAEVGYDAMVVNLTDRDFAHLKNIPSDEYSRVELVVGAGGAGKNPDVGAQAIREYSNVLLKKIQRKFNNKEFIFVAYGLGGGTGTMGGTLVAEIASALNIPVGVIVTLPRRNEGTDEKVNCLKGLQEVANYKGIKSIVVIDNQQVAQRLSDRNDTGFWAASNREIVSLFDRFNTLSAMPSDTAFDAEDYKKCLMTPGFLILGSSKIEVKDGANAELAKAIDAISQGFLATGFDHKTAIRAAGLIEKPVGYDYAHIFEENLFEAIKTDIGAGGLNRGIYTTEVKDITVNTMIAGMKLPEARVQQLVSEAKNEAFEMANKINQRQTEIVTLDIPDSSSIISGTPGSKKGGDHMGGGLLGRRRG
jgi:cell division GTPase FtsZ